MQDKTQFESKYRCIHCDERFDELEETWNHEEANDGHSVWITQEAVQARN